MDFPLLVRMPDGTPRETTTPVVAPVAALIARPHGGCGPACAHRPCTLADIEDARQLLTDDPRIVLWAELAVLAHLLGVSMPVPDSTITALLTGADVRLRDGAIGLAVADAVAARSAPLARTHNPEEFASHVAADLRTSIDDGDVCATEVWPWSRVARQFRWGPPLRALYVVVGANPGANRHPDTALWERAGHRPIPGATAREQLSHVEVWSAHDRRNPAALEAVLFGVDREPLSPLERSVGAGRSCQAWPGRLAKAVESLPISAEWASAYLDAPPVRWGRPLVKEVGEDGV
jgi:hypothetical protein